MSIGRSMASVRDRTIGSLWARFVTVFRLRQVLGLSLGSVSGLWLGSGLRYM
jgi:hypothetical protein